ncbi:MAG: tetratricopeptide repeat protein [candidate division WOR-3 bacterium]|nr:tetratricopeptide repeat protein [candidate division WOR-3 bacterium]MCX7757667.1 tetratricopeptide repeat protein [candidate division WOR-3 bacterium]MDW7987471.1 tetratricopeptide repeat protein [candidate division WOR-3 bacterium]
MIFNKSIASFNIKKASGIFYFLIVIVFGINCAYFNTFYNAQKYYKEAQEKLSTNPQQAKTSFEKAIEKSAKVISKYPRSRYVPNALFIIGMSYYYLGDYSKAITKFDNLLLLYPETKLNYQVNFYYAQSLLANKDYEKALERLKMLRLQETEKVPKFQKAEVLYRLAELHYLRKEYQDAIKFLRELIDKYPKTNFYFPAFIMLGEIQQAIGEHSEAIATYTRCKNILEKSWSQTTLDTLSIYTELLVNLAKSYIATSQESLSKIILDKITFEDTVKNKTKNLSDKVYLSLGKLFSQMNNFPEARKYYKKIKSAPQLTEAQWFLANSYEAQGKFDSASYYYQAIVNSRETTDFTAQAKIRLELLKALQDTSMVVTISKVTQKNNEMLDTLKGDTINKFLTDSLLLDKEEPVAYQESLKNSLNFKPDSAKIQFHLAEIYHLNLKDYEKALHEYEKVYLKYPKSIYAPKALLAQAWIYKNILAADRPLNENYSKYESILKTIIREYPNTEYAQEAKKMLKID